MLDIYELWRKEGVYNPRKGGSSISLLSSAYFNGTGAKILHGQWCARNFVNGRALARAYSVRQQLNSICNNDKNSLNMVITLTCGRDMISFLKCSFAGLFLQSATLMPSTNEASTQGNSGQLLSSRGRLSTHLQLFSVAIWLVRLWYTELLVAKKTYLQGVTQIREELFSRSSTGFLQVVISTLNRDKLLIECLSCLATFKKSPTVWKGSKTRRKKCLLNIIIT